ncbi:hypothetical protein BSLG_004188 [Batrachochytrium salamandrivorans]|nr:hypothetical protein BSLG_004188 [Batrachochytrium salamandrivorans]
MPVTKEAVDIIKQRMRALDARPIRKVAEAKFRKQMRTQRRLEKMSKGRSDEQRRRCTRKKQAGGNFKADEQG